MTIRLVDKMVTGKEPMLDPILTYLATKGMPAREIRSVVLVAIVGEPLMLDVSLFVQGEDAPTSATYAYPEGHGWADCGAPPCPQHPDEAAPDEAKS